jgi:hypothetical protein
VDLSGLVQNALAPLADVVSESGYYLVDERDPDCSHMLTQLTDRPIGGLRQPLVGGYWSLAEIDCFRSYLHDFRAESICTEFCSLPEECFVELGVTAPGGDCMTDCQAQVDLSGSACINAILDTVDCLGTCDFNSLSEAQILACQDEALVVQAECE